MKTATVRVNGLFGRVQLIVQSVAAAATVCKFSESRALLKQALLRLYVVLVHDVHGVVGVAVAVGGGGVGEGEDGWRGTVLPGPTGPCRAASSRPR